MQIAAACGVSQVTPVWSPDSSRLLFRAACGTEVLTPWVYTIDTRELRPSNDLPVQHAAIEQWVAGPSRLIVRETVGDATYLTAVPVSRDGIKLTGASQRLTSVTDYIARASSALDGRMVLSLGSVADHIWGLPIDRNGRAVGDPKQITHGPAGEVAPALSRDGGKVAFVSARANHGRVFYRDLATGQEKELSTDGGSFGSPVFNPEGSGVMCQHFFSTSSNRNSLDYLPISGGIPKKIWDRSAGSALWDWSPDGKTLLISTSDDLTKPWRGTVKQLDLESLGTVMLLEDPELHT
jgi:dipeptidyl aminopeptidase/acylaminoacyl peptidase